MNVICTNCGAIQPPAGGACSCGGTVEPLRLCVFGSRSLLGAGVMAKLRARVKEIDPACLVTAAEPCGACDHARMLAEDLELPLHIHYRQKSKAAGMYHHRTMAVYDDSNFALFLWDGNSNGTCNEIEVAKKAGIPHEVMQLEASIPATEVLHALDFYGSECCEGCRHLFTELKANIEATVHHD